MNTAWTAASEEMYKATQQAGANGDGQPKTEDAQQESQQQNNENVTDAEFEEVK